MKEKISIVYVCDICGFEHQRREDALECEAKPVTQDKGVKVGDIVLITAGDEFGRCLKVGTVGIAHPLDGHRLWHTVFVCGTVIGTEYSRILYWHSYEVVK